MTTPWPALRAERAQLLAALRQRGVTLADLPARTQAALRARHAPGSESRACPGVHPGAGPGRGDLTRRQGADTRAREEPG